MAHCLKGTPDTLICCVLIERNHLFCGENSLLLNFAKRWISQKNSKPSLIFPAFNLRTHYPFFFFFLKNESPKWKSKSEVQELTLCLNWCLTRADTTHFPSSEKLVQRSSLMEVFRSFILLYRLNENLGA